MEKEFVPYELALRMKQLGFDEPCLGKFYYNELEIGGNWCNNDFKEDGDIFISAPTFSQAFRWFREKCDLIGVILPYLIIGNQWYYKVTNRNNNSGLPFEEVFKTYEEAEFACLIKLIEIVESKSE